MWCHCVSEVGQYEGKSTEIRQCQFAGQQIQKPTGQHPAM